MNQATLNILQEQGARDIETVRLNEAIKGLEELYESTSDESKALLAHSLGLAYRRLGERGEVHFLEQAVATFEQGLVLSTEHQSAKTLLVELGNDLVITHIRLFELHRDPEQLKKAEIRLTECFRHIEESPAFDDAPGHLLQANILNNSGNLWKQRYRLSQETSHADTALRYYTEAEILSPEQTSPVLWATIQKNKGEVKYLVSKKDKNRERMTDAMRHCLDSLQYRDSKNAPYQWLKSITVIFDLVLLDPNTLAAELKPGGTITSLVNEFLTLDHVKESEQYVALSAQCQQVKACIQNYKPSM